MQINDILKKPVEKDVYQEAVFWCWEHVATIVDEGDQYRIIKDPLAPNITNDESTL